MKNKIDLLIGELSDAIKFSNDEDRIEVKASLIQMEILENVRKLMKDHNFSKKDLAEKMNRTPSFISQLLSGDKALNLKMIASFQEIFNSKFTSSFTVYSDYLSKDFNKGIYIKNSESKGWAQSDASFDLVKYQLKIREENKAA